MICPNVDPDTLLFNLYVDTHRFFDNSDGAITVGTLKRKAKNALKMSKDNLLNYCRYEIKYWKENRPLYIINPIISDKRAQLSYIYKRLRWTEIENSYDYNKSASENLENMEVSRSTIYRFCKEKHIDPKPNKSMTNAMKRQQKRDSRNQNIELFKLRFDVNLTIRENQKRLESFGLKLSLGTLQKWKEKYLLK